MGLFFKKYFYAGVKPEIGRVACFILGYAVIDKTLKRKEKQQSINQPHASYTEINKK